MTPCEPRHLRMFRSALRRLRNPTFWRLEILPRRGHTSSFFHLLFFLFCAITSIFIVDISCFLSGTAVQQLFLKMSFLGGAECSTAGNPLTQFTKHVQDDKSLQRDRLVGRGPGGMQEGMRSGGMMGGQDQVWQSARQMSTSGNGKLTIGPVNAIFVFSN